MPKHVPIRNSLSIYNNNILCLYSLNRAKLVLRQPHLPAPLRIGQLGHQDCRLKLTAQSWARWLSALMDPS